MLAAIVQRLQGRRIRCGRVRARDVDLWKHIDDATPHRPETDAVVVGVGPHTTSMMVLATPGLLVHGPADLPPAQARIAIVSHWVKDIPMPTPWRPEVEVVNHSQGRANREHNRQHQA